MFYVPLTRRVVVTLLDQAMSPWGCQDRPLSMP